MEGVIILLLGIMYLVYRLLDAAVAYGEQQHQSELRRLARRARLAEQAEADLSQRIAEWEAWVDEHVSQRQ